MSVWEHTHIQYIQTYDIYFSTLLLFFTIMRCVFMSVVQLKRKNGHCQNVKTLFVYLKKIFFFFCFFCFDHICILFLMILTKNTCRTCWSNQLHTYNRQKIFFIKTYRNQNKWLPHQLILLLLFFFHLFSLLFFCFD